MANLAPPDAQAVPNAGRCVTVDFGRCEGLLPGELDLVAALLGDDLAALLTSDGSTEPRPAGRDHQARASVR